MATQERKGVTIRVCMRRSRVSDRYSLRIKDTPDNPMNNPQVNRFYK